MKKGADFLIVGAPRSASTSMQVYLRQHPQIFFPNRKEVHFFGSDLQRLSHDFWFIEEEQQYLKLFEEASDGQIAGEASVMYLQSTKAAQEIKAFNPQMKIIILLRNPIDVIYSHHSHLLWAQSEDIENFEEALAAEKERSKGHRIPPCALMLDVLLYSQTVQYAQQVKRYFDCFGREKVHVLLFDDIKQDIAACYRSTLQYLGVDSSFVPEFNVVNENKQVRSRFLQRLAIDPPVVLRRVLTVFGSDFPWRAMIKLQGFNSTYGVRSPMSMELRQRLSKELEPEVASLGKLLGKDLSHWLTP